MILSKQLVYISIILFVVFSPTQKYGHAQEPVKLTVKPVFTLDGEGVDFLFSPRMLAVDKKHNEIYVVDGSGKNVTIYDDKGGFNYWFSFQKTMVDFAINHNGDIYAADNNSINILNYRGIFKKKLDLSTIPDHDTLTIQSLHIGDDKRIYIGDNSKGRIIILDKEGNFLYQFGEKGFEKGKIFNISKLSTDKERIYVLDPAILKISIFDKKGVFLSRFGIISGLAGGFSQPVGMDVDGQKIYVIDVNRMMAIVFDKDGKFLFEFGGEESGKTFNWPRDIKIDNNGKIYIADGGNKLVRVFEVIPDKKN